MKPTQEQMNEFLDDLRESSEVNMFQCLPNILAKFPELTEKEGADMWGEWARTFEQSSIS